MWVCGCVCARQCTLLAHVHRGHEVVLCTETQHVQGLHARGDGLVQGPGVHLPPRVANREPVPLIADVVEQLPAVSQLLGVQQKHVHRQLRRNDDEGENGVELEICGLDAVPVLDT